MRWTAHIILKQHHINTKYQHVMLKYHHILKVIHIRQLMPSIRKHLTAHIVWYDTTSYLWYYTFPLYYTPSTTLTLRYIPNNTIPSVRPFHYILSTSPPLLHSGKKKLTKYSRQCFLFLFHFQAYNYIIFS